MDESRVRLSPPERRELESRVRSRVLRAEDVRRAKLMLMLAQGASYRAIRQALGCNANYISCWKARFLAERLSGALRAASGSGDRKADPEARSTDPRVDPPGPDRRLDALE